MNILILGTISGVAIDFIDKMIFGDECIANIYHLSESVDFLKTLELLEVIPHQVNFVVVPGYDENINSTEVVFIYEYKKENENSTGVYCEEFALING